MDKPLTLVAVLSGVFVLLALVVYWMCWAVRLAKKSSSGAYVIGAALLMFNVGLAHDPTREVRAEMRRLKREDGDSGDPPEPNADESA
jgi:uncharacterized membrane protein